MQFVYRHALLFAGWMIWLEKSPWPTLTLFVRTHHNTPQNSVLQPPHEPKDRNAGSRAAQCQ
ncbi:MAG: hypothetical protein JWN95_2124 [Frankiales bacterium]|nr:hypothetical protein [Frankiales bacterium]